MEATITSKGQATIPKPVREHLNLEPGDRVKFFIQPDGHVVMLPKIAITALRGIVPPREGPAPTIDEMDEAIQEAVVEEYLSGGQ
jgi:AbrB family looped-hinge helix DNA binding protein